MRCPVRAGHDGRGPAMTKEPGMTEDDFDIPERKWFVFYFKCTIFVHYNVHKYTCFMVVISSAELRNNMKKYLDIAKNEKVVIQRGRNETFVLVAQNNAADEDLSRAITVDEVLARVREGLNEMFERKEDHNIA